MLSGRCILFYFFLWSLLNSLMDLVRRLWILHTAKFHQLFDQTYWVLQKVVHHPRLQKGTFKEKKYWFRKSLSWTSLAQNFSSSLIHEKSWRLMLDLLTHICCSGIFFFHYSNSKAYTNIQTDFFQVNWTRYINK